MKPLIENNRLFLAMPPLFKIYTKDKEFFAFYRSMEAYKKAFKEGEDDPTLILSPDSDFFKYFGNQSGK